MSKNGISWIKPLSIALMLIAVFAAFMSFLVFLNSGCKELPDVEVSPDLEIAVCLEACHIARDMGCERIGKDNLTVEACEPLCKDLVARNPRPNFGCAMEAATCERIGSCW